MTNTISIELTPQEQKFFDGYNIALRHNPTHDPDKVQEHLDAILRRSFNALPRDVDSHIETVLSALLQQQAPEHMLFQASDSFSDFVLDWFLTDLTSYIEENPEEVDRPVNIYTLLDIVWEGPAIEGSFTYSTIKSRNIIKRYLDDIVELMDVGNALYRLGGTTLQDAITDPERTLVDLMMVVAKHALPNISVNCTPLELSKLIVERLEKKHD